jgi:hypothetical protein
MSGGYFFLRPKKPAAKEPNPSKPSNGSGEAVWGSFWPEFAFAFWSAAEALSAAVEFLSVEVALWSAAVVLLVEGVVELEAAAFWSVLLGVVVLVEGLWAAVELAAAFWSALVLLGEVVLLVEALWSVVLVLEVVELLGALVLEAALWSVELGVCAGGFTGALALSPCVGAWAVLLAAAGVLAFVVSVVGACALPAGTGVLLLVEVEAEAALWSVELAEAGDDALDVVEAGADALEADWSAAEVPAAAPDPEAWLFVQESEIMLTELTCSEPSLARVPCTWTWCPSWGFSMELSPCRLMLWPLSEASTQFPPDCFRQPRIELDWSLVLVAVEFVWSVVEGEVDGLVVEGCWLGWLDWSGDEPEPPCANAIPEASISARINFLFMSLLLRSLSAPVWAWCESSRQRPLR